LGLVALSTPMATTMYISAFPAIAKDLGVTTSSVQLSVVSFLAALAIGQNIFGPSSDRFGRKSSLYVGLGIFIFSSIGASFSASIEHLIAWRFLQGFGACAAQTVPRAVVRDLYTGIAATRMMGLIVLVTGIVPLFAPLIGSVMVDMLGWRSVFWTLAGAALIGLACVFFLLPETHAPASRRRGLESLRGYAGLLHDPAFMCSALMIGFSQGIFFAFVSGSSQVFIEVYGLSAWAYGVLFAAGALAWTVSAQFAASLIHRFGAARVVAVCGLITVLATSVMLILALLGLGSPAILMVGVVVVLAALGILVPVATVFALHEHGHAAGSASAIMGTLGFGLGALATMVIPTFADGTERPMLATMAGCAILAAVTGAIALVKSPPTD
jgi:DHA1 family bicyclomycin/chloramphenicol resistance-like MFS transporter